MAYSTINSGFYFVDNYKDKLNLTPKQIEVFGQLENEYYKTDYFNIDPYYSKKKWRFRTLRKVMNELSCDQQNKLVEINKQYKREVAEYELTEKWRGLARFKDDYREMELTEDQFKEIFLATKLSTKKVLKLIRNIEYKSSSKINKRKILMDEEIKAVSPLLSNIQLEQFIILYDKAKQKLLDLNYNHVKYQNKELELTDDQARAIFEYNDNRLDTDEEGEFISPWEKSEQDKVFYRKILNDMQFEIMLKKIEENVLGEIRSFSGNEEQLSKEIKQLENKRKFLVEEHLPEVCRVRKELHKFLSKEEIAIVDELRNDYAEILVSNYEEYKKTHMRFFREYNSTELIKSKKSIEMNSLYPNGFCLLKRWADIQMKIRPIVWNKIDNHIATLENVRNKLKDFVIKSYEESGGKYGIGVITLKPSKEDLTANQFLSYLLLETTVQENIENEERLKQMIA